MIDHRWAQRRPANPERCIEGMVRAGSQLADVSDPEQEIRQAPAQVQLKLGGLKSPSGAELGNPGT